MAAPLSKGLTLQDEWCSEGEEDGGQARLGARGGPSTALGFQLANKEFVGLGGKGKDSPFLRLQEGQICDPKEDSGWCWGVPRPQEGATGPTAARTGARRGAARSGLGRGRRAHLHLGRTVRPLGSVANRMSPSPGFSPCPASSSVSSSSSSDTSARPSTRGCLSVCLSHAGGSRAGAGAGARAREWGGGRPRPGRAEGRARSGCATRTRRIWFGAPGRPGAVAAAAAAASAAGAGVEAGRAPQRGRGQG